MLDLESVCAARRFDTPGTVLSACRRFECLIYDSAAQAEAQSSGDEEDEESYGVEEEEEEDDEEEEEDDEFLDEYLANKK